MRILTFFLLLLFSCSKTIETSDLEINIKYCKKERKGLTYLSDFKIFKDDSLYKTVNPKFYNNQFIKSLEYGNYRIDFKNIFRKDQSVYFRVDNNKTDTITLCVDSIDYEKEKEKHTPFIDRLKGIDSYSMKIKTTGCFLNYENEMIVNKEDSEYYVSFSKYIKKLQPNEIELIRKFELELINMNYGGCTSSNKFILTHKNDSIKITNATCSVWSGYSDLLDNLFNISKSSSVSSSSDMTSDQEKNVKSKKTKNYSEVKRNDSISKTYYEIGRTKGKNGDYEGSIEEFSKAIKLNSTNADFYIRRGISKEYLKEYESAIEDYLIAAKIEPNHKDIYYGLGNCYLHLNQLRIARLCYSHQLKITPDDYDSYINRGVCDYNLGNYDKVISDLNLAIEIKSDEKLLYYYLAQSYLELNSHKEVIKNINKAIKLDPKNGEYYYIRAQAQAALKMDNQANLDFKKATKLGYNITESN